MCEEDTPTKTKYSLRNGANTNTQGYTGNRKGAAETEAEYKARRDGNIQNDRVLFESWEWYDKCAQRNRNKGWY